MIDGMLHDGMPSGCKGCIKERRHTAYLISFMMLGCICNIIHDVRLLLCCTVNVLRVSRLRVRSGSGTNAAVGDPVACWITNIDIGRLRVWLRLRLRLALDDHFMNHICL
jgi:hypothetical protein